MKKVLLLLFLLLALLVFYVTRPVYQFYAHRGAVPFLTGGTLTIPELSPKASEVYRDLYKEAGKQAIEAMTLHQWKINTPGLTAAVGVDGDLVWAGAVGWADIEEQRPMTVNSQLRIGSTSKALTSTLLARMLQEGKVELDAKVGELALGELNPNWRDITPRQLASHMAGLPHYKENTERLGLYQSIALNRHYSDVNDAVTLFDQSDMLFSPGEDFSYSSFGTVLLSAVLQERGGQRFQALMTQYVFAPLNMQQTLTSERHSETSDASEIVDFYWRQDETKREVREWRKVDLSHRLAGGGFVSTSSDLVRLGLGFVDPNFIAPGIREQFWTPQRLNNGEENEQGYAIGWRVYEQDFGEPFGKLTVAHHGGVSRGAQSWLMVIVEKGMVIAVNMNAKTERFADFAQVAKPIAQAFLHQYENADEKVDNSISLIPTPDK